MSMRRYQIVDRYVRKYGQYALDRNYKAYLQLMGRASNWHKTRVYKVG